MISKERLEGNWNRISGQVREKYGQITSDELEQAQGSVEQLVGLIQRKTGQSREQVNKFLGDCVQSTENAYNRLSEKAGEYAEAAGHAVRENYDRVAEEAHRGYDYTVRTVSKRPLESVAVALGAGLFAVLVIGLSMATRRR